MAVAVNDNHDEDAMADCFVGEIRVFAGIKPPAGWVFCNGQTLPITGNEALYSLIGTIYGGDGRTTFGLPNLQGQLAIGQGQATGSTNNYAVGNSGGQYSVTLTQANMPAHNHSMAAVSTAATSVSPQDNCFAAPPTGFGEYVGASAPNVTRLNLDPNLLTSVGTGAAHLNVMPTICTSYIIATTGLYPDFP